MCLWYKPTTILEHNILFSYGTYKNTVFVSNIYEKLLFFKIMYSGNQKEPLVLWKIKKKQDHKPVVIFRILNILVMQEKIDSLIPGQWHHLCQYWEGSTGLWALFFNNYIVSFGYTNVSNNIISTYFSFFHFFT